MNRSAFVHVNDGDKWRVYEALFMKRKYEAQRLQPSFAQLLYVDDSGAIRIIETEEIRERISARYYVLAADCGLLAQDITDDYKSRGLYRETMEDIKSLKLIGQLAQKDKAIHRLVMLCCRSMEYMETNGRDVQTCLYDDLKAEIAQIESNSTSGDK